jgi:hypothetical protein
MPRSPLTAQAQYDGAGYSVYAEKTAAIASAAGTTVVKGAPGRVINALVTTAGTSPNNALIYDNTAGSGTVLAEILGGTTVGTQITIQMPAAAGITVVNVASGPGFTLGIS